MIGRSTNSTAHRLCGRRSRWLLVSALGILAPAMAHADPCEAPLPAPGTSFSGVVRYVGDGDSLCIGPARDSERWIEIRLADFRAPELRERGGPAAKRLLGQVASGRRLQCLAGRRSYDRVVALCRIEGVPVGNLLRAHGGREGGR